MEKLNIILGIVPNVPKVPSITMLLIIVFICDLRLFNNKYIFQPTMYHSQISQCNTFKMYFKIIYT